MRLENWDVIDEGLQELESSLQISNKSSTGRIIIYYDSFLKTFTKTFHHFKNVFYESFFLLKFAIFFIPREKKRNIKHVAGSLMHKLLSGST